MLKNSMIVAGIVMSGLAGLSSSVLAAAEVAPVPVPAGQVQTLEPKVAMADAVAKVEKAYDAKSVGVNLRPSNGTLLWCVRLMKADGERLAAYVDAMSGEITSARTFGKADTTAPLARGFHHARPHHGPQAGHHGQW